MGGYAVVLTLGDVRAVRAAARLLFPTAFTWPDYVEGEDGSYND